VSETLTPPGRDLPSTLIFGWPAFRDGINFTLAVPRRVSSSRETSRTGRATWDSNRRLPRASQYVGSGYLKTPLPLIFWAYPAQRVVQYCGLDHHD
jgi:hypothetical protein